MHADRIILAGIDEAGYGPLLGPLCVGLSVFSIPLASANSASSASKAADGDAAAPTPETSDAPHVEQASPFDLWAKLSAGVTRERPRAKDAAKGDAQGRIAIADSKQLKLASDSAVAHPLVHLERGVLAMLTHVSSQVQNDADAHQASRPIATDAQLFAALGAAVPLQPWYAEAPFIAMPQSMHASQLAIASNILGRTLQASGVRIEALRTTLIDETRFNTIAREQGGKAATTWSAVAAYLQFLFDAYAASPSLSESGGATQGRLGVTCDRLGGRVAYAQPLQKLFPAATITTLEESPTRSRYIVVEGTRRMGVSFLVEGEKQHLPIALASMIAKLSRELLMQRFNTWWAKESEQRQLKARAVSPAPIRATAGYATDALRWLRDAQAFTTKTEREELTRIA
jgi:hypothetical protein